jgi:hypothetical protein
VIDPEREHYWAPVFLLGIITAALWIVIIAQQIIIGG